MAQNKPKTNQANSNRHGPKITSNTRQSRISKNFIYSKRDVNDRIYLLTETAPAFFEKKGYEKISRTEVPELIQASTEFSSVCPVSAIAMKKSIA